MLIGLLRIRELTKFPRFCFLLLLANLIISALFFSSSQDEEMVAFGFLVNFVEILFFCLLAFVTHYSPSALRSGYSLISLIV